MQGYTAGERGLLPCPFCGGKAVVWRWGYNHTVIECVNYNVDTHRVYMQGDSEAEVIKAWNRRAGYDSRDCD